MKLLAPKSLKTELRLKRYRVLKLQGLKCKILELETDFLLNRGLNHNLIQAQGVLCKTAGLIQILIYFLQRKNGGPSPQAVDRVRVAVPRWTHDRDRAVRSPERGSPALQSPGARRGLGKKERSSGGPHRGLQWPIRRRGEAGGGEVRCGATRAAESGKWGAGMSAGGGVSSSPFCRVRGGSGVAGWGRGSGGRWWRHQCRSSGLVGRGNGGVSGE
jgi:hypothetical protein